MDPDGPDGSGRTRTGTDEPKQTQMDQDRPEGTQTDLGVLIGSKRFFQTLELITVEYAFDLESEDIRTFFICNCNNEV